MGKIKLSKYCQHKNFTVEEAVDFIKSYWAKYPEFICYDSTIVVGKDEIKNAIGKAKTLGLGRIKPEAWIRFERWLNKKYKKDTTIKQLVIIFTNTRKKKTVLKGIREAAFTKTVHRLRPKEMPIVDNKICKYYNTHNLKNIIVEINEDCAKYKKQLEVIANKCSRNGIKISSLRAWDILVWSTIKNKGAGK